jgi:GAF domain-containing protein
MRKSKSTTQIKERRILEALRDSAEGIIEMDKFYAALYDRRDVVLYFPVAAQRSDGQLKPIPELQPARSYRPDIWLPDYIFIEGTPVFVDKNFANWLAKHGLKYEFDPLPGSWIGVPLVARGRVLGVIVAEHMQEEAYDMRALGFLTAMANRAAGAIANSRLVESLRVVNQVGQALTSRVRLSREEILTFIYKQTGELMNTDDMYIALYDQGTQMLGFPFAMMDGERQYDWPSRRVDLTVGEIKGLTEEVLINKRPLCPKDVEAWFQGKGIKPKVRPVPKSWVGVPLLSEDKVLGIISLQNDEVANLFGPDDIDVLQAMAGQAAVALENTRLVDQLNVVNEVGQTLAAGIDLDLGEILELVYEQTGRLMDTRNMYIAMYDQDTQTLRFPLAMYNCKREYDWPARKVDLASETVQGLTEEVLRTRRFLNPENVEKWYANEGVEPKVLPVPKSWVGVPIISGERILGVIALQNDEVAKLYSDDDIEVLQTLAGQAAVAIENARLYEHLEERVQERTRQLVEAQQKIAGQEAVVTRTMISTDFVHRLNNLAGTIPIWAGQIREHLNAEDIQDEILDVYLTNIETDTEELLRAAEQLKSLPEAQSVNVGEILRALVRQGRIQTSSKIDIRMESKDKLPPVRAVAMELRNALWSVMENGIDAMPDGGTLRVTAESSTDAEGEACINIEVQDEGIGIPQKIADKIFSPFYSTKEGHMGYGLWRAKNIFERIGGSIAFNSSEGHGTTFIIRLPGLEEVGSNV